jgi:hypothetical protein
MQQLRSLWPQSDKKNAHTGKVFIWSAETFDKTHLDRVGTGREDDRDRFGRCLCSKCRRQVVCVNHRYIATHKFSCKRG